MIGGGVRPGTNASAPVTRSAGEIDTGIPPTATAGPEVRTSPTAGTGSTRWSNVVTAALSLGDAFADRAFTVPTGTDFVEGADTPPGRDGAADAGGADITDATNASDKAPTPVSHERRRQHPPRDKLRPRTDTTPPSAQLMIDAGNL
jgi:hypothetical protein